MDSEKARFRLQHGAEFPIDRREDDVDWVRGKIYPATDWAHVAARGVLSDLSDRRGLKQEFDQMDQEVLNEIVESVAEIIRQAPGFIPTNQGT